jgi:hypothetical protein
MREKKASSPLSTKQKEKEKKNHVRVSNPRGEKEANGKENKQMNAFYAKELI